MKARTINPKLADFIESEWNPYIRQAKMSWKVDERIARDHIVPYFEGRKLKDISSEGVKVWYHFLMSKGLAISTCNRILYVLKNIFNFAVGRGFFEKSANPLQDVHWVKKNKTQSRILEAGEVNQILYELKKCEKIESQIVLLILYTGAKKNEILKARWENYFPDKRLLISKQLGIKKIKRIWLSEEAYEIISSLDKNNNSPWLFPGRDIAKPLSDIFLYWNSLRSKLGYPDLKINEFRTSWLKYRIIKGSFFKDLTRYFN